MSADEKQREQTIDGLTCFPPRDRCMVAPRVVVTEHNYTIACPKCGQEVTAPSYAKAYAQWWEICR